MKYASLKPAVAKTFRVPRLDGGLALNAASDIIDNNKLSDCVNMWHMGGHLVTRPALCCAESPVVQYSAYEETEQPLNITDTVYYKDGVRYNIAYLISGDNHTFAFMQFFLIDAAGGSIPIGKLEFYRISSELYYQPQNVFFAVGNPQNGAGIYAFVTAVSGDSYSCSVYEAGADLSEWIDCRDSFYIPVLYVNGRGTRYGEAQQLYSLSYGVPRELEQRNLLTGWFKTYYTSDGVSSVFRLPVANLDESPVYCRIYSDSESYTQWIIPVNSSTNTQSFAGHSVTVKCDRKAGVVSFSCDEADFSIPIMPYCSSNNIMIRTCKTVADGVKRVVSSKRGTVYDGGFYVCGNSVKPNEVYGARLTNPLYFPKNAKAAAGESTNEITALSVGSNKLIAFKSGELYRIDVTEGGPLGVEAILDEGDDFSASGTLRAVAIHKSIGCDCPKSILRCGNRLVWLCSDGRVYMLATTTYGKENNVYEVSSPIAKRLSETDSALLKGAFAVDIDGCYALFCGSTVWLMYYRVKSFGYSTAYSGRNTPAENIAWYCWQLPESAHLASGTQNGGKAIIGAIDPSGYQNYCLTFGGDTDRLIVGGRGEYSIIQSDTHSRFSTKAFDFGCAETKKHIDALFITADIRGSATVTLSDGKHSVKRTVKGGESVIRLSPDFGLCTHICVSLCSGDNIRVSGLAFKYRLLSEVIW